MSDTTKLRRAVGILREEAEAYADDAISTVMNLAADMLDEEATIRENQPSGFYEARHADMLADAVVEEFGD